MTLIPGDGVGPEIVDATRIALEATGVSFDWDERSAGLSAAERGGSSLPEATLESIRGTGVALKGPLGTPTGSGSVNVALRKLLDLYALVRPCRWYPGVRSRYRDVDIVIVREATEGAYAGVEFEQGTEAAGSLIRFIERTTGTVVRPDSGLSIKAISEGASERIARFAFAHARANGRRKVTVGHKANIMKVTDGLFLEVAQRVALGSPDVAFEARIVDDLTMQLVRRPGDFDVLLLPNLYGDILSEVCAGLVGGLGVAPGANHGEGIAVFEATHGTASAYRGLGRANPMALMLSGAMMLRHLGEVEAGDRLEGAIAAVIAEGRDVTYDLKPSRDDPSAASTSQVRDAVVARLAA